MIKRKGSPWPPAKRRTYKPSREQREREQHRVSIAITRWLSGQPLKDKQQ